MTPLSVFKDIIHIYFGILGFLSALVILCPPLYMLEVLLRRRQFLMLLLFTLLLPALFIPPVIWAVSLGCSVVVLANTISYLFFSTRTLLRGKSLKRILEMPFPKVAVIVTAKDEAVIIRETIESLIRLDYSADKLDIILVDDGSTDNMYACVQPFRNEAKNFRIIRNQQSQGKAHTLNRMFRELEHEYILILDADHLVDAHLIRHMLQCFTEEDIACVQVPSRIRNGNRNLLTKSLELEYLFRCFSIYPGKSMGIFVGSGGMFRRKDVLEAGGFDPSMLTEDVEISYRLYKNGKRIRYDDGATTYDLATEDFSNFYNQRYRWMRGLWSALIKHLQGDEGKKLNGRLKFYFIQFTSDGFGVLCLCILQMYYFFGLMGWIQFDYAFPIYALSLSCIFTFGIGFWRSRTLYNYNYFILFSLYMIAHTIPAMVALIDSFILKKPATWVKTDRSRIYQQGWGKIFR